MTRHYRKKTKKNDQIKMLRDEIEKKNQ